MRTHFYILLLCCCWNNSGIAQELAKLPKAIILDSISAQLSIEEDVEVFVDRTWEANLETIKQQTIIPLSSISVFDYRHTYWLRFYICNKSEDKLRFFMPLCVQDENSLSRVRIPVFEATQYKVSRSNVIRYAGRLSSQQTDSYAPHKQYFEFGLRRNEVGTYYIKLRYDWRDFSSNLQCTKLDFSQ